MVSVRLASVRWRAPPPGARSAPYCVRRAKRVKPSACLGKGRFCSRRRRSGSTRLLSSPGAAPGSNSGHFVSRPAPPLPSSSSTDGAVRRKKRWPRRGKRFSRRTASWGQPYQQQRSNDPVQGREPSTLPAPSKSLHVSDKPLRDVFPSVPGIGKQAVT